MPDAASILRQWRARLGLNRAYRAVFDNADGQRVLADLLIKGNALSTSQVEGAPDQTAFNEGKRALVLGILSELRWSEMQLFKLAQETTGEQLSTFNEEHP